MTNPIAEAFRRAREAKGLTKADVGRAFGVSGSAVSQWEAGKTTPDARNILKAETILGIRLEDLIEPLRSHPAILLELGKLFIEDHEWSKLGDRYDNRDIIVEKTETLKSSRDEIAHGVSTAPEAKEYGALSGLARDVPIRGIAVGGSDGDFEFNGQDVDMAIRPTGLASLKNVFALYVTNDSMYPAWKDGALFYVNPNRPPAIGDDVVVEVLPRADGEPSAAFLKRLKARRGNKIVVEQFNPPKEIEFDRNEVRLYRVIPWEEALGLS